MTPKTPKPKLPPGAVVDVDEDGSFLDAPTPRYHGPDGDRGLTDAEVDAQVRAGGLPPVPRIAD